MYREDRDSIFLNLFGRSPQSRILDLFLDNPLYEFTKNEIIEALGMAKVTLYNTLPIIEESGIIKITRKIGKANLYRLNSELDNVKHLRNIIRNYSTALAANEKESKEPILSEEDKKELIII
jgi:DNA-binding transcriptional ArsR family regulator